MTVSCHLFVWKQRASGCRLSKVAHIHRPSNDRWKDRWHPWAGIKEAVTSPDGQGVLAEARPTTMHPRCLQNNINEAADARLNDQALRDFNDAVDAVSANVRRQGMGWESCSCFPAFQEGPASVPLPGTRVSGYPLPPPFATPAHTHVCRSKPCAACKTASPCNTCRPPRETLCWTCVPMTAL